MPIITKHDERGISDDGHYRYKKWKIRQQKMYRIYRPYAKTWEYHVKPYIYTTFDSLNLNNAEIYRLTELSIMHIFNWAAPP